MPRMIGKSSTSTCTQLADQVLKYFALFLALFIAALFLPCPLLTMFKEDLPTLTSSRSPLVKIKLGVI